MVNKFEIIINKFVDKYGKVIFSSPNEIVNYLNKINKKFYKKSIDYKKYLQKNKDENTLMILISNMFWDHFYKGENLFSIKKGEMIGPVGAKIKNQNQIVSLYLDNKKNIQVSKTQVFAFYNHTKKTFMWTYPDQIEDICKKSFFKKYSFCNANMIKNIQVDEADNLAIWFRLATYIEINIMDMHYNMKTNNLILFNVEINKEDYTLYCIVDYGIKDPKFDLKMSAKIDLLKVMINSEKKEKMKGIKMYNGKHINKLKL